MNDNELDKLLLRLKEQSLPDCPGNMEGNVLRRVRLRSETGDVAYWEWLPLLIARPRFLAGVCVMAVMMSASLSLLFTQAKMSLEMQRSLVVNNLDFEVFNSKEFFALEK